MLFNFKMRQNFQCKKCWKMLSNITVATCVWLYIALAKMRLYNTKEQRHGRYLSEIKWKKPGGGNYENKGAYSKA